MINYHWPNNECNMLRNVFKRNKYNFGQRHWFHIYIYIYIHVLQLYIYMGNEYSNKILLT